MGFISEARRVAEEHADQRRCGERDDHERR
jgi:hypothetical protein